MPRISTDNYDTVASWNGSQDLFIVEQPDGTKVATPAMVKQYVLGDMDDVPTEDSNNPVKSGGIFSTVKDVYSVMGQNGAKNLIPYPYYRQSGYSSNGMTITYDSDGVLTINKVASSSTAYFSLINNDQDYCFKPNTEYKLLFELENANQLTIYLKYGDADIVLINKKSTGKYVVNFTTPQTLQGRENLAINAAASDTETNAKVKAMIMLASDTDNTYQPYAKTNKKLTEAIGDLSQTGLTGDSVAAQLDAAKEQIAAKRSKSVSSSVIGNGVNVASATSENPFTTPHEGFVRFDGTTCLCVNDYRMMKSSANADYKGMWLPKGVSIYFADATPNLAQWFNCSNE